MVLGANLKKMKSDEVKNLYTHSNKNEPDKISYPIYQTLTPSYTKIPIPTEIKINHTSLDSFKKFNSRVDEISKTGVDVEEQLASMLNQIKNEDTTGKILGIDFNCQALLNIARIFNKFKIESQEKKLIEIYRWFLEDVANSKNFKTVVVQMLTKNEKMMLKHHFANLNFDVVLMEKYLGK